MVVCVVYAYNLTHEVGTSLKSQLLRIFIQTNCFIWFMQTSLSLLLAIRNSLNSCFRQIKFLRGSTNSLFSLV